MTRKELFLTCAFPLALSVILASFIIGGVSAAPNLQATPDLAATVSASIAIRENCCTQSGGVILDPGEENPKDMEVWIWWGFSNNRCGVTDLERAMYIGCLGSFFPAEGHEFQTRHDCFMSCCGQIGASVVPVQDWLDDKYTNSLDVLMEISAGAGCAMPRTLQDTYNRYCYHEMCPISLWESENYPTSIPPSATPNNGPTYTPTTEACTITLTASPKYIMPGTRSTISVQAIWSDGQPIANAPVDYYVSRGPGSVGGGSPVTDGLGRLNFDYYAPQNVGTSTSAMVAVTVGDCTMMTSIEIIFGPSPTPTPTHTPTPTIATGTPTSTPTTTTTPTTPTPAPERSEGDLSLNRIVVLQAVEGAQLVGGRDVGIRVFLNWNGAQPAQVEVQAAIDDLQISPVTGEVKATYTDIDRLRGRDAINLILDWEQRPPASGSPYWNLFPKL